jgi:hypothetical protein
VLTTLCWLSVFGFKKKKKKIKGSAGAIARTAVAPIERVKIIFQVKKGNKYNIDGFVVVSNAYFCDVYFVEIRQYTICET